MLYMLLHRDPTPSPLHAVGAQTYTLAFLGLFQKLNDVNHPRIDRERMSFRPVSDPCHLNISPLTHGLRVEQVQSMAVLVDGQSTPFIVLAIES